MTGWRAARGEELRWEPDAEPGAGCARWSAVVPAEAGESVLELGEVSGSTEVLLDGALVARVESAFRRTTVPLPDTGADRLLELRCTPLDEDLRSRRPRGRWRTTLVAEQGVRWRRVPMLGRAPFLGPVAPVLGPYRPSFVTPSARPRWRELAVDTRWDGETGELRLAGVLDRVPEGPVLVRCAGVELPARVEGLDRPDGGVEVRLSAPVPDVEPWWPRVLGEPVTHPLQVWGDAAGGHLLLDTRVGFRTVEVDLAADDDRAGVAFLVNGVPLHARGAVWTPVRPERWSATVEELEAAVELAVRGGAAVVRVVGTTLYEQPEFWDLCASAGLFVWQDLMVANVDLPDDPGTAEELRAEVRQVLRDVAGSPSLLAVSGGSEVRQQAEMSACPLGTDEGVVLTEVVPRELERLRPGTPYVPSTPWTPPGHGAAIRTGAGIAHYFGVGGYRRPVADVRSADVRFAAEALALSVPPVPSRVERWFGGPGAAGHDPAWKAAVPRDRGASWDFEDVRDHYVAQRHGVDPREVRAVDPERLLALGAETAAALVSEVTGWWRSPRSRSAGGLVLSARDVVPGAGWGLVDSGGVPKSTWFAARRRWSPRAVWVDDRGLDGLWVEVHDDRPDLLPDGQLSVRVWDASGVQVHAGGSPVSGCGPWSADELLGGVYDPGRALRFGPPRVAAVSVEWAAADGRCETPSRLVWMPEPAQSPTVVERGAGARVSSPSGDGPWAVEVWSEAPVRAVVVDVPGYLVSDSWFDLAPDRPQVVYLEPLPGTSRPPRPRVSALGGRVFGVEGP